jgi:hypothetical protein
MVHAPVKSVQGVSEAAKYAPISAVLGVVHAAISISMNVQSIYPESGSHFSRAGVFSLVKRYYSSPVRIPACSQPGVTADNI